MHQLHEELFPVPLSRLHQAVVSLHPHCAVILVVMGGEDVEA